MYDSEKFKRSCVRRRRRRVAHIIRTVKRCSGAHNFICHGLALAPSLELLPGPWGRTQRTPVLVFAHSVAMIVSHTGARSPRERVSICTLHYTQPHNPTYFTRTAHSVVGRSFIFQLCTLSHASVWAASIDLVKLKTTAGCTWRPESYVNTDYNNESGQR